MPERSQRQDVVDDLDQILDSLERATGDLESGEDLANISKVLGHAKLATTADLYAHLTPQTQDRMAERMDAILTG